MLKMPEIGEIRTRTFSSANVKQIFSPCAICGKYRWVKMTFGKPSTLICLSCSAKQKNKNPELRAKRSVTMKLVHQDPIHQENFRIGHNTPEAKENHRKAAMVLNNNLSIETREKRRQSMLANYTDPEFKQKMLDAHRKPESRKKAQKSIVQFFSENEVSAETKEKHVVATKKRFDNPEILKAHLEKMRASQTRKPNKAELKLLQLIKDNKLPYEYVGDGKLIIGGYNPDYCNNNGQKKLIEMFGQYWHSPAKIRAWYETEQGRIEQFKSLGFDCLVIWENELRNQSKLLAKIKEWNDRTTIKS